MKKAILAALSLVAISGFAADGKKIISQSKGSITFVVDEFLEPVSKRNQHFDGSKIAYFMMKNENIREDQHGLVATSFADEKNLLSLGRDAFYQCIVKAYAKHQSVVLSPDMIWLLISQGFARYVNAHDEEMRPKLVGHEGKKQLVVETDRNLFEAEWPKLIDQFGSQIDQHTKRDIAKTITANFTTTGPVERVASQITLMESVKSYFEYMVMRVGCGIPSITLEGTPDDWRSVLKKTKKLEPFGLETWTKSLEPILTEFIRAAEGKPRQQFWQGFVKKDRVKDLVGGAYVSSGKTTQLDGWMLKFFPNEDGLTLDSVPYTKKMPTECVRVGFKYKETDLKGNLIGEMPMELWAGFIGAEEDVAANTLRPKIGWLVRMAETDE
ncbi:MAG: DUF4419 domain-containing protein [Prevotella sp.]|nr:DUF4419 domain-containing protein [Prevotella sp.]